MAASRTDEPVLEVRGLVKHFPLTTGILFKKQVGAVRGVGRTRVLSRQQLAGNEPVTVRVRTRQGVAGLLE